MNASLPKLDDLDRAILKTLMADARTPYAEMAKQFDVSLPPFMCVSRK